MNAKQIRILADAYAEGMMAGSNNGLDVNGADRIVFIAKTIQDAELIVQPDGSLSIVSPGMTILIRPDPENVHAVGPMCRAVPAVQSGDDGPTIERLGPAEDWE